MSLSLLIQLYVHASLPISSNNNFKFYALMLMLNLYNTKLLKKLWLPIKYHRSKAKDDSVVVCGMSIAIL